MMNNNIMNLLSQLQSNPLQVLGRRFNIPANLNNPQSIIQHLLNSGQVSQDQVNRAMQMRNNPMIRNIFR